MATELSCAAASVSVRLKNSMKVRLGVECNALKFAKGTI